MIDSPILSPQEIVYFVKDIDKARDWFLQSFGGSSEFESEFYNSIKAGGVSIGFHPSDEKTQAGVRGQVAYWLVDEIDTAIRHFIEMGCTIFRGPIKSVDSQSVVQLIDPFGNAIGLIERKK
ncbi:glyoxalase superfamily protein [Oxyplasma meridianum]|uniref:Glyoxalase superfamily protein n=1 Tax=Oxyplasma meridianum TaxID=3073602 RepID=A0AAX4NDZ3_9ARCH